MPRFGSGFDLRCFQVLSAGAWLRGNAINNPYTRGADPPFLSYLRDLPLWHLHPQKIPPYCLATY